MFSVLGIRPQEMINLKSHSTIIYILFVDIVFIQLVPSYVMLVPSDYIYKYIYIYI
jgi:hypothetical protein